MIRPVRPLRLAPLAVVAALFLVAPAGAQDDTIPQGVTVGGVPVGGLTRDAARVRIDEVIARPLLARILVTVAGRRFSLLPRAAGVKVDSRALAEQAYRQGRQKAASQPPGPDGSPQPVALDIPVPVTPTRGAGAGLVARVAATVYRPPRNSEVRFNLHRMWASRAFSGRRLAGVSALRAQVLAALTSWTVPHELTATTAKVRPRIGPRLLRARTGPFVTVSRHERKARLFSHLRLVKVYRVAVGQPAWPTPTGLFHVQSKQVDPAWSVPNQSWAGSQGGQVIPGGSDGNPLKARWIGFADGVGFHGTADVGSLGGAQSHGCVRMRIRDVKDLYRRVRVGTPVYVR
jgi:lipoprotein-anchoring transpeptidase ErfK/SrfK